VTVTKFLAFLAFVVLLALAWLCFVRWDRDASLANDVAGPAPESSHADPLPELALEDRSAESTPTTRVDSTTKSIESSEPSRADSGPASAPHSGLRRIVGRVIDVGRRAPVEGCSVQFVQDVRSSKRLLTDSAGRFETEAMFEPGVVGVLNQPVTEGSDVSMQWSVEPSRFSIDDVSDTTQPFQIELVATPRVRIDIEVRNVDGTPVAGAQIFSSSVVRRERAGTLNASKFETSSVLSCDERGRATLWASREFAEVCALNLRPVGGGGVGPNTTIEPPLPTELIVLRYGLGGSLDVHVLDARGEPVSDARVGLSEPIGTTAGVTYNETSDAMGLAAFSDVPPGNFELSAVHLPTRRRNEQPIEIPPGENVDVKVTLADVVVRVGVSGRVLDENGAALAGVDIAVHSEKEDIGARSGDDGTFEVQMIEAGELSVEIGYNELDDLYEPANTRVAFGTTDLVVRRTRKLERSTVSIQLVDHETQRTIRSARIRTARRPSGAITSWIPRDGLTKVTLSDRTDAWILLGARGYKSIERPTRELVSPTDRSDVLTIELSPGFERIVTFVDRETSAKLAGVAMIQGSGATERSDAQGNVVLRAREWPAPYRIELDGYRSIDWDPNYSTDWESTIKLEKLVR
jgi:hypothetical protein